MKLRHTIAAVEESATQAYQWFQKHSLHLEGPAYWQTQAVLRLAVLPMVRKHQLYIKIIGIDRKG